MELDKNKIQNNNEQPAEKYFCSEKKQQKNKLHLIGIWKTLNAGGNFFLILCVCVKSVYTFW